MFNTLKELVQVIRTREPEEIHRRHFVRVSLEEFTVFVRKAETLDEARIIMEVATSTFNGDEGYGCASGGLEAAICHLQHMRRVLDHPANEYSLETITAALQVMEHG